MNIDIELPVYKSLVMHLADEQDTLNAVIKRLLESPRPVPDLQTPVNQRDPGYWYRGHWHRSKNAIDVYLGFLEMLDRDCDSFCEKFARACTSVGNFRPYIANDKEKLYPNNHGLGRYARPLNGWWVDGNISNRQKIDLMSLAARAAGLTENIDYKISIPSAG